MTAISPGQEVPSRTAQKLRQVHTITDRFGMLNTYLIDDGGLVVVDPRSSLNGQLILYYIERFLQRSPTDIDLIVLTSLETNQSGGIETLRQRCRAPVAALSKTRSRASSTGEPGRGGRRPSFEDAFLLSHQRAILARRLVCSHYPSSTPGQHLVARCRRSATPRGLARDRHQRGGTRLFLPL